MDIFPPITTRLLKELTLSFHTLLRLTTSEENPVSLQRSCGDELCRNTKNDRYLDPPRSSHVWSLSIDESFLCFFVMLVDQVVSFYFKISAPTTAVCSTVKDTWEQFIGGK